MKRISATSVVALATAPAMAQDTQRELDAHVHGVSTLEVAVEGHALVIDLFSPGMDIVGFEYEASSDADKDAIGAAVRSMLTPENILTLPEAAECRLTGVLAHLHGDDHGHDDHAEGDDHGHDDHAEDDDHGHDDHAEDDDHEHEEGAVHSEFHAKYWFDCAHPEDLTAIGLPFFQVFTNAQEIEAQYVTETGAGAAEIGRDAAELTLD